MITRIVICAMLTVFFFAGCHAKSGRVKVDDKGFEIEASQDSSSNKKDKHCPPGHRKKGWCDQWIIRTMHSSVNAYAVICRKSDWSVVCVAASDIFRGASWSTQTGSLNALVSKQMLGGWYNDNFFERVLWCLL